MLLGAFLDDTHYLFVVRSRVKSTFARVSANRKLGRYRQLSGVGTRRRLTKDADISPASPAILRRSEESRESLPAPDGSRSTCGRPCDSCAISGAKARSSATALRSATDPIGPSALLRRCRLCYRSLKKTQPPFFQTLVSGYATASSLSDAVIFSLERLSPISTTRSKPRRQGSIAISRQSVTSVFTTEQTRFFAASSIR
jgi:hypothetical protein